MSINLTVITVTNLTNDSIQANMASFSLLESKIPIVTVKTPSKLYQTRSSFFKPTSTPPSLTHPSNCSCSIQQYDLLHFQWIVALVLIVLVVLAIMITIVTLYRIRSSYMLKRQINQFKRIDAQLGLDQKYRVNYENTGFYF
jgi:hypothetical protein